MNNEWSLERGAEVHLLGFRTISKLASRNTMLEEASKENGKIQAKRLVIGMCKPLTKQV